MDFAREGWCTRATRATSREASPRGSARGRTIFAGVPCVRRGGRERVCVAERARDFAAGSRFLSVL